MLTVAASLARSLCDADDDDARSRSTLPPGATITWLCFETESMRWRRLPGGGLTAGNIRQRLPLGKTDRWDREDAANVLEAPHCGQWRPGAVIAPRRSAAGCARLTER
jgi:hypothetical protein